MSIVRYIESLFISKRYRQFYRRERLDEIASNDMLMIIDMQSPFLAQAQTNDLHNKTHYQAGKVQEAMGNGASILYVEYNRISPTIPALAIPVSGYHKFRRFAKECDDAFVGSSLDGLIKESNPEIIHTMGCYAECCVASTVRGGAEKGFAMVVHLPGVISKDSSEINMMKAMAKYEHYKVPIAKRM